MLHNPAVVRELHAEMSQYIGQASHPEGTGNFRIRLKTRSGPHQVLGCSWLVLVWQMPNILRRRGRPLLFVAQFMHTLGACGSLAPDGLASTGSISTCCRLFVLRLTAQRLWNHVETHRNHRCHESRINEVAVTSSCIEHAEGSFPSWWGFSADS